MQPVKTLIANEPDFLDVIIVLASVGLDEAAEKKNDTYNNETINYAKSAINKMKSDENPKNMVLAI